MFTKRKHFSCSEQVLTKANEKLQIPNFQKTYLKIASGFGGGVSRRGSICGAVSGGVMALGLRFGTDGTEPYETFNKKRLKLREIVLSFLKEFESRFGSVECRDLLGFELWTELGWKKFMELWSTKKLKCRDYIASSTELINKLLDN